MLCLCKYIHTQYRYHIPISLFLYPSDYLSMKHHFLTPFHSIPRYLILRAVLLATALSTMAEGGNYGYGYNAIPKPQVSPVVVGFSLGIGSSRRWRQGMGRLVYHELNVGLVVL